MTFSLRKKTIPQPCSQATVLANVNNSLVWNILKPTFVFNAKPYIWAYMYIPTQQDRAGAQLVGYNKSYIWLQRESSRTFVLSIYRWEIFNNMFWKQVHFLKILSFIFKTHFWRYIDPSIIVQCMDIINRSGAHVNQCLALCARDTWAPNQLQTPCHWIFLYFTRWFKHIQSYAP